MTSQTGRLERRTARVESSHWAVAVGVVMAMFKDHICHSEGKANNLAHS